MSKQKTKTQINKYEEAVAILKLAWEEILLV